MGKQKIDLGKAFSKVFKAVIPPPPPPPEPVVTPPVVNTVVAKALPVVQSGSSSNTFVSTASASTSAASGGTDPSTLPPGMLPVAGKFLTAASTVLPGLETPAREVSLAQIQAILRGDAAPNPAAETEYGSNVLYDPVNVNGSGGTSIPSDWTDTEVAAFVESNRPVEEAALAELTPADHALYDSIRAVSEQGQDPRATLALQALLFEGKLTDTTSSTGSRTLDELATLASPQTPLVAGVNRAALVTDTLGELAVPSAINQGPRGTCAPTVATIDLANARPAEYVRIISGLASPAGQVTLAGGEVLKREPGSELPDDTYRSASQKLITPALMEFANGFKDYNDATDEGSGTTGPQFDRLFEALNGHPADDLLLHTITGTSIETGIFTPADRATRQDAFNRVLFHAQGEGLGVPVGISVGTPPYPSAAKDLQGHKVLVTGEETVDGVEYVKYTNPWGQEERMPQDEFVDRMMDVNFPREFTPFDEWRKEAVQTGINKVKEFLAGF